MKKISIIGFGRFGKVLYRLVCKDFDVIIFDKNKRAFKGCVFEKNTRIVESVKDIYESHVVFYCVPISQFERTIKEHKKFFTDHLLIDVLSVKELPQKVFRTYLKGTQATALLTHPMFGPDSSKEGFSGLRMVMDQHTASVKDYSFWKKYFISKKLRVIELTPKKHDKLAAHSQGITHFIGRLLENYAFAQTLIDTRGAEELFKVMKQTTNDSWELFTNLQNYNFYSKEMRVRFGKSYDYVYKKLIPTRIDKKYTIFGIQGGKGSFNEEALLSYIKKVGITDFKIIYLYTSEKVLKHVYEGTVDYGVFATHNSLGGIVSESVQAMSRYKFTIVDTIEIPIRHFLLKRKDMVFNKINTIMAHPQVFKQCKNNLHKNFPHLLLKTGVGDLVDTAKAAQALGLNTLPKTTAILGPHRLAELYNLDVVAEDVQDHSVNITSFLLVTR